MNNFDSNIHGTTLREKIYSALKDKILNLEYPPGYVLVESKLSEIYGVSRTPIREALAQLELDGLIKSTQNRGVVVTGITQKDIEDIYELRKRIEGLATRLAAENISDEELERLGEIVELEEFHTNKKNIDKILEIDSMFHDIVFKASGSKTMCYMLTMFHDYIRRARLSSLELQQRAPITLEEHRAIYEAIKDRDPDKAEKLAVEHIRKAQKSVMKTFEYNKIENAK